VTLFKQRSGESLITETLVRAHEVNVQSQRARVTLFQDSPSNCHRVGSSGLNLVCNGLLLGMLAEGHGDPCTGAHPRRGTLANLRPMITSTVHIRIFCKRQLIAGALARMEPRLNRTRWMTPGARGDSTEGHPCSGGLKAG
jgi:hypothetical protein